MKMPRSVLGVGMVLGLIAAVNAKSTITTGTYSNGSITSTAQSTPCPYGTAPVFDEVAYTVGRDCAILQDYAINPYYYWGATVIPSLSSQCAVKWTSSHEEFLATAKTGPSSMDTVTANFYAESFSFTPTAPCCSSCTLSGANVQVRFWPTPAPDPAVSILVDPDTNFTYTSPSVYVVFSSLGATDLCGDVGATVYNTTLSFRQSELSTSMGDTFSADYHPETWLIGGPVTSFTWTAFNYADLNQGNCSNITVEWWSHVVGSDSQRYSTIPASMTTDIAEFVNFQYTYNPCSPTLSVPSQIRSLMPAWQTCIDGIYAFYDPPFVLHSANGLVAPGPTTTAEIMTSTTPATVGPTPVPQIASFTTTASPVPRPSTLSSSTSTPVPVVVVVVAQPADKPFNNQPASDNNPPASNQPINTGSGGSQPIPSSASRTFLLQQEPSSNSGDAQASSPADPAKSVNNNADPPSQSLNAGGQYNPEASPVATLGSQTITAVAGGLVMAGTTLNPGAAPLTIDNTPMSVGPSAIFIGSTSIPLPAAVIAKPASLSSLGGQEIGSANIIISTSSVALVGLASTSPLPSSIAGLPIRPLLNNCLLIGTSTLCPGALATISGTPISIGPNAIIVGTSTYPVPAPASASAAPTPFSFHIAANGGVVLPNGATLAPGAPATTIADGTVMSLLRDSGGLVVNGSTIALAMPTPTGPEVLTIAGATMTAGPGDLVWDGETITAGGAAVTIGGTRVSLEGSDVVVGTQVVPLPVETGLGGLILSGFGNIGVVPTVGAVGNGTGTGNGTGVSEFFGGAGRRREGCWGVVVAGVVGLGVGVGAFVL